MVGRILFLSVTAFAAYQYIRRKNHKVQQQIAEPKIEILPPEPVSTPALAPTRYSSSAVEDLSQRY